MRLKCQFCGYIWKSTIAVVPREQPYDVWCPNCTKLTPVKRAKRLAEQAPPPEQGNAKEQP